MWSEQMGKIKQEDPVTQSEGFTIKRTLKMQKFHHHIRSGMPQDNFH